MYLQYFVQVDLHLTRICLFRFSGICAGIRIKTELGLENFTIFEENEEFGGTWLLHKYPGCASDIAAHLYSFSFELNPGQLKKMM